MSFKSHRFRKSKHIFRSRQDKVVFGVLGGLAEYFDLSSFWLRLGCVVFTFIQPHITIPLYLLCFFLMPSVSKASPSFQPPPVPRDPFWETASDEERVTRLFRTFDQLERKVQKMESFVTSKEFTLKQKFQNL